MTKKPFNPLNIIAKLKARQAPTTAEPRAEHANPIALPKVKRSKPAAAASSGHTNPSAVPKVTRTKPIAAPQPPIPKLGGRKMITAALQDPLDELTEKIRSFIDQGEDPDETEFLGESAIGQCCARNAFDAVRLLVAAGARTDTVDFSETHKAVIMGETIFIEPGHPDLLMKDGLGRTPFLLACRIGSLVAARALERVTPDAGKIADDEETPLHMAARSGSVEIIAWLLDRGADVNARNTHGRTALLTAVEENDLELAKLLLDRGADPDLGEDRQEVWRRAKYEKLEEIKLGREAIGWLGGTQAAFNDNCLDDVPPEMTNMNLTPAQAASSKEMLRLLASHGPQVDELDEADLLVAVGADRIPPIEITPGMFKEQFAPRPGIANPERVDIPFWREQIRTGRIPCDAAQALADPDWPYEDRARPQIWSFHRSGRTVTRLTDGRWVLIGGEHEDESGLDFCIYADVTVIGSNGEVEHYIYPEDVFPPTDFHTATLLDDHIILIGSLGYQGRRRDGEAQVLRLNLGDFSIQEVACSGDDPGWISMHETRLTDGAIIVTVPGTGQKPSRYTLDLQTMTWHRKSADRLH